MIELRVLGRESPALAVAHAGAGDRAAALAEVASIIDEWERVPDLYMRPIPFEEMAVVHVLLGEPEEAIDLLETLLETQYGGVVFQGALTTSNLRLDPTWDPLRDHPRFQALLEEFGNDVEH